MTEYEDFKQLRTWHPMFDDLVRHPENLRIILVSSNEVGRLQACEFFKEVLEEKLEEEKSHSNLQEYEVAIIDISQESRDFLFTDTFERSGIDNGKLFIPIYHNADNHLNLPQFAFDRHKPAILSYTPEGFWNIINSSKRNCYCRIDV